MTRLALQVAVAAPVETVWAAATDWDRQHEWMLGTSVRVTKGDGRSVGSTLAAFTGKAGVGFTDHMEITVWDPPHRCQVLHTGWPVQGPGIFAVREDGPGRSRFVWGEDLYLPFGVVGAVGWPLVRPFFVGGVRYSLNRFAEFCEEYT
ncbi:SRPBCC family protein [Allokutzneria sp. NRRL B-24872]|uniref:SRPBCC family protein n=1 Tax=Allokutzneria sp. NRRL B-24872 TaxID=1137961 RepID=UPI000A36D803|nr:SRPBCC family protein [Allokutzneria sp. NRRL B-24872]